MFESSASMTPTYSACQLMLEVMYVTSTSLSPPFSAPSFQTSVGLEISPDGSLGNLM